MASYSPADRDRLVRDHTALAYKIASTYRIAGQDADDLRQQALLALVRAADSFTPAREVPFGAYAGTCIRRELNSLLAATKAAKRTPPERTEKMRQAVEELEDPRPRPDKLLASEEGFQALLKILNPQQREVMEYRYRYDTRPAEISRQLGLSVQRVRKIEQAALARLRQHMGITVEDGAEEPVQDEALGQAG